jgi:hypothetical protein
LEFYRQEARRILAGQKKLSTILVTPKRVIRQTVRAKNVDSKADGKEREMLQAFPEGGLWKT